MRPRITVFTIGVDDLERSLLFYRDGLGLPTQGIVGTDFEHGAVAFFDLQGGAKFAIWPRSSISHDTGIPETPPNATEVTLGHNVSSREEVDAVMEEARNAGATIVRQAHDTFWGGYAGYLRPRRTPVGGRVEPGAAARGLGATAAQPPPGMQATQPQRGSPLTSRLALPYSVETQTPAMRSILHIHGGGLRSRLLVALLAVAALVPLREGWNGDPSRHGSVEAAQGQDDAVPGPGDLGFEQGDGCDGILAGEHPAIPRPALGGRGPGLRATTTSLPVLDVPSPVPI